MAEWSSADRTIAKQTDLCVINERITDINNLLGFLVY